VEGVGELMSDLGLEIVGGCLGQVKNSCELELGLLGELELEPADDGVAKRPEPDGFDDRRARVRGQNRLAGVLQDEGDLVEPLGPEVVPAVVDAADSLEPVGAAVLLDELERALRVNLELAECRREVKTGRLDGRTTPEWRCEGTGGYAMLVLRP
jgi:hypothetical protein